MSSVLIVSNDHIGSSMSGPGIRYLWFARELARRGYEVTLVVPFATDLVPAEFELRVDNPWHSRRMTALAKAHDAVVAQRLPVPSMIALSRSPTRAIYDLYAPLTIEHAALAPGSGPVEPAETALHRLSQRVALESGDAFVCASEKQRDLWLGALTALGRITPEAYGSDPSFRTLIDVVPFGIDPVPPRSRGPVLKGVVPGIEETDKVALWGGGLWDWLDPLTVIRAVRRLERKELKLFVLGTRSPNPAVPRMAMEVSAIKLADDLGMLNRSVFVNEGWVRHEERGAYLLEADVGVSAHRDELETRFAFRTRLVDCIWASLPVITSPGDSVAPIVEERNLGRVVDFGDVERYAGALADVLDQGRAAFAESFCETRALFEWPRVVDPLARLLEPTESSPTRSPARISRVADYALQRSRLALATRGGAGLARRVAAGAQRSLQGDHAAHPDAARGARGDSRDPSAERLP
jgi:glycosyltransferase involved in cell wall biosynthesis